MFRIDKRQVQFSATDMQLPLATPVSGPSAPEPEPKPAPQSKHEEPTGANNAPVSLIDPTAEIRKKAEKEAKQLLAKANLEASELKQQAWDEGYAEGKAAVEQAYQELMQDGAAEIKAMLAALAQAQNCFFDDYEHKIVQLVLATARKVVYAAIHEDEEAYRSIILNALKQLKREGYITIRMSEQQYEAFFKEDSATFVLGDESIHATIVNDPLLKDGDLLLEAEGQTINAGVDSQFKYITMAFGRAEDFEE